MEPFRLHLFVCTQQKPEGVSSCAANGSLAVLAALDREIQACASEAMCKSPPAVAWGSAMKAR